MIVQRTKTYAVCPNCQQDAGQIDHLLGQETRTAWYCDECGQRYSLQFRKNGDVEIASMPERKITTCDVLKLEPQEKPVYFVVSGMRFERDGAPESPEDIASHKQFFYEEHSCPTNWLQPEMVYYDGESDPHGLIKFVDTRDESSIPPDESVSPNDHDDALIAVLDRHAGVVR